MNTQLDYASAYDFAWGWPLHIRNDHSYVDIHKNLQIYFDMWFDGRVNNPSQGAEASAKNKSFCAFSFPPWTAFLCCITVNLQRLFSWGTWPFCAPQTLGGVPPFAGGKFSSCTSLIAFFYEASVANRNFVDEVSKDTTSSSNLLPHRKSIDAMSLRTIVSRKMCTLRTMATKAPFSSSSPTSGGLPCHNVPRAIYLLR